MEGCAIGNSTSGPMAEAYMEDFEVATLESYWAMHNPSPGRGGEEGETDQCMGARTTTQGQPDTQNNAMGIQGAEMMGPGETETDEEETRVKRPIIEGTGTQARDETIPRHTKCGHRKCCSCEDCHECGLSDDLKKRIKENRKVIVEGSVVLFWYREVDDTIVCVKEDHADSLVDHLNRQDKTGRIKFMCEKEKDGRIAFLDSTIIHKRDGKTEWEVYRKPTNMGQYIQYDSDHQLDHKVATVRSLRKRSHLLSSDEIKYRKEEMKLKEDLSINGYTKYAWDKGEYREKKKEEAREGQETESGQTRREEETRPKVTVMIPYHEGITSRLRRAMSKAGVSGVPQNGKKIGEKLVKVKDKLPMMKTASMVYHVPCTGGRDQTCM